MQRSPIKGKKEEKVQEILKHIRKLKEEINIIAGKTEGELRTKRGNIERIEKYMKSREKKVREGKRAQDRKS